MKRVREGREEGPARHMSRHVVLTSIPAAPSGTRNRDRAGGLAGRAPGLAPTAYPASTLRTMSGSGTVPDAAWARGRARQDPAGVAAGSLRRSRQAVAADATSRLRALRARYGLRVPEDVIRAGASLRTTPGARAFGHRPGRPGGRFIPSGTSWIKGWRRGLAAPSGDHEGGVSGLPGHGCSPLGVNTSITSVEETPARRVSDVDTLAPPK